MKIAETQKPEIDAGDQGPYSLVFLSLTFRLRLWFETQTLEIRIH